MIYDKEKNKSNQKAFEKMFNLIKNGLEKALH